MRRGLASRDVGPDVGARPTSGPAAETQRGASASQAQEAAAQGSHVVHAQRPVQLREDELLLARQRPLAHRAALDRWPLLRLHERQQQHVRIAITFQRYSDKKLGRSFTEQNQQGTVANKRQLRAPLGRSITGLTLGKENLVHLLKATNLIDFNSGDQTQPTC